MVCVFTICKKINEELKDFCKKKKRETGEFRRELFNKKYGHHEWVTTCAHLKDGRLLSGGMDSLLCLWDKSIVKCENLMGHGYNFYIKLTLIHNHIIYTSINMKKILSCCIY